MSFIEEYDDWFHGTDGMDTSANSPLNSGMGADEDAVLTTRRYGPSDEWIARMAIIHMIYGG